MRQIEAIRGRIHCTQIEIRLPGVEVRQPGWTRMAAALKAVEKIGLEIDGADRMLVIPVPGGDVLVRMFDYGEQSGRSPWKR